MMRAGALLALLLLPALFWGAAGAGFLTAEPSARLLAVGGIAALEVGVGQAADVSALLAAAGAVSGVKAPPRSP